MLYCETENNILDLSFQTIRRPLAYRAVLKVINPFMTEAFTILKPVH